jgi:hypothetical protein
MFKWTDTNYKYDDDIGILSFLEEEYEDSKIEDCLQICTKNEVLDISKEKEYINNTGDDTESRAEKLSLQDIENESDSEPETKSIINDTESDILQRIPKIRIYDLIREDTNTEPADRVQHSKPSKSLASGKTPKQKKISTKPKSSSSVQKKTKQTKQTKPQSSKKFQSSRRPESPIEVISDTEQEPQSPVEILSDTESKHPDTEIYHHLSVQSASDTDSENQDIRRINDDEETQGNAPVVLILPSHEEEESNDPYEKSDLNVRQTNISPQDSVSPRIVQHDNIPEDIDEELNYSLLFSSDDNDSTNDSKMDTNVLSASTLEITSLPVVTSAIDVQNIPRRIVPPSDEKSKKKVKVSIQNQMRTFFKNQKEKLSKKPRTKEEVQMLFRNRRKRDQLLLEYRRQKITEDMSIQKMQSILNTTDAVYKASSEVLQGITDKVVDWQQYYENLKQKRKEYQKYSTKVKQMIKKTKWEMKYMKENSFLKKTDYYAMLADSDSSIQDSVIGEFPSDDSDSTEYIQFQEDVDLQDSDFVEMLNEKSMDELLEMIRKLNEQELKFYKYKTEKQIKGLQRTQDLLRLDKTTNQDTQKKMKEFERALYRNKSKTFEDTVQDMDNILTDTDCHQSITAQHWESINQSLQEIEFEYKKYIMYIFVEFLYTVENLKERFENEQDFQDLQEYIYTNIRGHILENTEIYTFDDMVDYVYRQANLDVSPEKIGGIHQIIRYTTSRVRRAIRGEMSDINILTQEHIHNVQQQFRVLKQSICDTSVNELKRHFQVLSQRFINMNTSLVEKIEDSIGRIQNQFREVMPEIAQIIEEKIVSKLNTLKDEIQQKQQEEEGKDIEDYVIQDDQDSQDEFQDEEGQLETKNDEGTAQEEDENMNSYIVKTIKQILVDAQVYFNGQQTESTQKMLHTELSDTEKENEERVQSIIKQIWNQLDTILKDTIMQERKILVDTIEKQIQTVYDFFFKIEVLQPNMSYDFDETELRTIIDAENERLHTQTTMQKYLQKFQKEMHNIQLCFYEIEHDDINPLLNDIEIFLGQIKINYKLSEEKQEFANICITQMQSVLRTVKDLLDEIHEDTFRKNLHRIGDLVKILNIEHKKLCIYLPVDQKLIIQTMLKNLVTIFHKMKKTVFEIKVMELHIIIQNITYLSKTMDINAFCHTLPTQSNTTDDGTVAIDDAVQIHPEEIINKSKETKENFEKIIKKIKVAKEKLEMLQTYLPKQRYEMFKKRIQNYEIKIEQVNQRMLNDEQQTLKENLTQLMHEIDNFRPCVHKRTRQEFTDNMHRMIQILHPCLTPHDKEDIEARSTPYAKEDIEAEKYILLTPHDREDIEAVEYIIHHMQIYFNDIHTGVEERKGDGERQISDEGRVEIVERQITDEGKAEEEAETVENQGETEIIKVLRYIFEQIQINISKINEEDVQKCITSVQNTFHTLEDDFDETVKMRILRIIEICNVIFKREQEEGNLQREPEEIQHCLDELQGISESMLRDNEEEKDAKCLFIEDIQYTLYKLKKFMAIKLKQSIHIYIELITNIPNNRHFILQCQNCMQNMFEEIKRNIFMKEYDVLYIDNCIDEMQITFNRCRDSNSLNAYTRIIVKYKQLFRKIFQNLQISLTGIHTFEPDVDSVGSSHSSRDSDRSTTSISTYDSQDDSDYSDVCSLSEFTNFDTYQSQKIKKNIHKTRERTIIKCVKQLLCMFTEINQYISTVPKYLQPIQYNLPKILRMIPGKHRNRMQKVVKLVQTMLLDIKPYMVSFQERIFQGSVDQLQQDADFMARTEFRRIFTTRDINIIRKYIERILEERRTSTQNIKKAQLQRTKTVVLRFKRKVTRMLKRKVARIDKDSKKWKSLSKRIKSFFSYLLKISLAIEQCELLWEGEKLDTHVKLLRLQYMKHFYDYFPSVPQLNVHDLENTERVRRASPNIHILTFLTELGTKVNENKYYIIGEKPATLQRSTNQLIEIKNKFTNRIQSGSGYPESLEERTSEFMDTLYTTHEDAKDGIFTKNISIAYYLIQEVKTIFEIVEDENISDTDNDMDTEDEDSIDDTSSKHDNDDDGSNQDTLSYESEELYDIQSQILKKPSVLYEKELKTILYGANKRKIQLQYIRALQNALSKRIKLLLQHPNEQDVIVECIYVFSSLQQEFGIVENMVPPEGKQYIQNHMNEVIIFFQQIQTYIYIMKQFQNNINGFLYSIQNFYEMYVDILKSKCDIYVQKIKNQIEEVLSILSRDRHIRQTFRNYTNNICESWNKIKLYIILYEGKNGAPAGSEFKFKFNKLTAHEIKKKEQENKLNKLKVQERKIEEEEEQNKLHIQKLEEKIRSKEEMLSRMDYWQGLTKDILILQIVKKQKYVTLSKNILQTRQSYLQIENFNENTNRLTRHNRKDNIKKQEDLLKKKEIVENVCSTLQQDVIHMNRLLKQKITATQTSTQNTQGRKIPKRQRKQK